MSNYLELKVPVRQDAEWFMKLRERMAAEGIDVRWQNGFYHTTVAFIDGDNHIEALCEAFYRRLSAQKQLSLTIDKLDVFATGSGSLIIHLGSTHPSQELMSLVEVLREDVMKTEAKMNSDFRLHITLGRIGDRIKMEHVKEILAGIEIPAFTVTIGDAEYRYFRGKTICRWKLTEK